MLSIVAKFCIDSRPTARFGSSIKEIEKYRDKAKVAYIQILTQQSLTQFAHTEFFPSMGQSSGSTRKIRNKVPESIGRGV